MLGDVHVLHPVLPAQPPDVRAALVGEHVCAGASIITRLCYTEQD